MSQSEELKAENARLAARVAELEALLAAKPPIDRASLYRMTDAAPWGVMSVSRDGVIDYANRGMQRWLTRPPPASGDAPETAVSADLWEAMREPLAAAMAGATFEDLLVLRDASGEPRDLKLTVVPRGTGSNGITGAVASVYDVTEHRALDRAVRENEARLAQITAVSPTAIYLFDFNTGSAIWAAGLTEPVYGYTPHELVAGGATLIGTLIHPEDIPSVGRRLRELAATPDGHVSEFELRVRRRDGGWRWILDRAVAFERDGEGRVIKTLSAAIDIDERKQAEERRVMLINELNHRVKNTLASVQSIARQTLRSGRPPEQAMDLFTARLVALSAAHNVLTRENWSGAALHEIAQEALAPFTTRGDGRIRIEGPDARLCARAAVGLAMALHELATNAAKYGALSGENGRVDLTWTLDDSAPVRRLALEWRERDGPAVSPPARSGFGSRLLTQGLPGELDGTTDLVFDAAGVVCRITAPLEATPVLDLA
ncbi:sensor histidine kinase [Phenylobacterium kunshanense]|uniref:histidine kinase n=1 Tax=Phenylobacterium kunshanense TaxID=1445034 RepID=A0A328B9T3_9CAUL|nr:HWE histidine kinase domain-containing protein [Phenylobacterium kunshanense]RAK62484.1 histidine kinase [Phenylobacterium kunshanense]